MNNDAVVRQQLLALLRDGNAHLDFEQAVANFPLEHINTTPPNGSYTPCYGKFSWSPAIMPTISASWLFCGK